MIERERFEVWARQRWAHPEDFDQRIKAPMNFNEIAEFVGFAEKVEV